MFYDYYHKQDNVFYLDQKGVEDTIIIEVEIFDDIKAEFRLQKDEMLQCAS
jgi:hypothetical protein